MCSEIINFLIYVEGIIYYLWCVEIISENEKIKKLGMKIKIGAKTV